MLKTKRTMGADDARRDRQGAPGEAQGSERGQTVVEMSMVLGFLVALAVLLNGLLSPLIFEAFHKIAKVVSAIGP